MPWIGKFIKNKGLFLTILETKKHRVRRLASSCYIIQQRKVGGRGHAPKRELKSSL